MHRRWAVLVLLGYQLALGAPSVHAQETQTQTQTQTSQQTDLTNPKTEATFVDNAENELVVHTTDVPVGILSTVQGWGLNVFTTTPPELTYDNKELRAIWIALSLVAMASLGLGTLWTGFKIVHAPWSGARPVRDLWLVAFGAIGIALSLVFCREVIDLNNILCLAGGSADPRDLFLKRPVLHDDLALLAAALIFEFAAMCVALKLVVRQAMVMLLTALSSLGFYAWTQPETKWLGQLWLHGFIGWTLGQFLTVSVLKAGLLLTTQLDPNSRTGTTISAYILGIVIMFLAFGLPDLIARYAGVRTGVPGVLSTAAALAWTGLTRLAWTGLTGGMGSLSAAAGGVSTAAGAAASAGAARGGSAASSGWTASATRKAATFTRGGRVLPRRAGA
jgi:hypothetical protein